MSKGTGVKVTIQAKVEDAEQLIAVSDWLGNIFGLEFSRKLQINHHATLLVKGVGAPARPDVSVKAWITVDGRKA